MAVGLRTERSTPAPALVRPRLLSLLDACQSSGVALVVAPAGFGKSTLLDQYARAQTCPVAVYRAEPADAATGRTARRLTAAVRAAHGAANPWAPHGAANPWAPRGAAGPGRADGDGVAELLAEVGAAGPELLLVIDNADCIIGTPDDAVLATLLANRPPRVRAVIAGRRMPTLNLPRDKHPGVLGAEHLRFRTWEVERLMSSVYAEPLPPDEVALLTRRTGGWAVGLAMFHLSTRGRPLSARTRAVAALSGSWAAARDYLARNLLAGLGPHVRDFLVRTSVFDVLTAARCDRLLATTDSAQLLADLPRRYGLPVNLDERGGYRYHQVLRSHLGVALVEDLGETGARAWHANAAALLEEEGAYAEAVRSYARAGEWTAVRRLLAQVGGDVVDSADRSWDELLPGWLVAEDPWLVYAEARRRLTHGQVEAAIDGFRQAEALFADDDGRQRCLRERRIAAIWLPDEQPARIHWNAWLRAATRRHPGAVAGEALALGGAPGDLVRLVADLLSGNVVDALGGRVPPSGAASADGGAGFADGGSGSVDGGCAPALALRLLHTALRLAAGDLTDADAALELDLLADEAESIGVPWLARMARAARALGRDPAAAEDADAVAAECDRRGDRWGWVLATALGCLHEQRFGRPDPRRLGRLVAQCRALGAGVLQAWAQAFLALAAAAEGLPDADVAARAAATLASRAGVPGGYVAATVALARLDRDRRESLLREAEAQALAVGLPPEAVHHWAADRRGYESPPVATVPAVAPAVVVERVPPLSVRCFGGFQLELAGVPVDLSSVRARARSMLRLFAMQAGQAVHREVLIEALWPDLSPAAATRNLQVTISALRGLLEPDSGRGKSQLLVRTGDAYAIAIPAGGYADTHAFSEAFGRWQRLRPAGTRGERADALRTVLAAYGGELLPEEGPAEWVVQPRERFHRQATMAAAALAATELELGHVAEAIAAAEQGIGLDPHDDDAWQVLLRAYAEGGAPAKAAEARRRYAEMLASLGVAR